MGHRPCVYVGGSATFQTGIAGGFLIAKAEAAARLPMAGRVVPEKRRDDVREVFLRTYRIVSRVRKESIVVLTVFEGHRRLPAGAAEAGDE